MDIFCVQSALLTLYFAFTQVSWIRHRDLHILSVGPVTYTTDNRFEAIPEEGAGNWMLRLRYASPRDSGQYDCQVSSRPPTYRTVHLTVVGKSGALYVGFSCCTS